MSIAGQIRLDIPPGPPEIELLVRTASPDARWEENFVSVDVARFKFAVACQAGYPLPLDPMMASHDLLSGDWMWGNVPWNVAEILFRRFMNDGAEILTCG
jgi:hypothetical protein